MKTLQRATAFVTAAVAWSIPMAVLAQGKIRDGLNQAAQGPYGKSGPPSPDKLPVMVGNLIGTAFDLFGILLIVYLLYGGYTWLTAGGDGKKVEEAQAIIKNAVIGIVILVSANFIAGYVITRLDCSVNGNNC